ncbi:hypothetical protein D3C87_1212800 [compost metagenome]
MRTACVFRWVVSSPASGSVTAKQAFSCPAISGGSAAACWASEPNTTTGFRPNTFMWMADAPENPAPDADTVCMISAASVMPSPAPPYCSGMAMPSQPAPAIAL